MAADIAPIPRIVLPLTALVWLGACSLEPVVPLPGVVASPPPGAAVPCPAALLTGVLAADRSDPRLVWIVAADGHRIDVDWPPGYGVRFGPEAMLIGPGGSAVARVGERIDLRGGTPPDGIFEVCRIEGVAR